MKIRKISLNKVVTNHNTVNVPVRRPHDHKYVNQESFRRFYVYVIKRLCDWDAERVYKGRSVLVESVLDRQQRVKKGKEFSTPHLRVSTHCRQTIWGCISFQTKKYIARSDVWNLFLQGLRALRLKHRSLWSIIKWF